MSFDINWNKLDDELAGYVIQFLNRNFQTINKPAFIGNINVIAFDWGTTAPTIEIIDITDPFPEFYEPTDTEDDLDNNNNNTNNNNNNNDNNNDNNNNDTRDTNNTSSNTNINNNNNNNNNNNPLSPLSNDPYFDTMETNSNYRPERFSYPLNNNYHHQQQLQQQRIQLMHSFHRSPLVAPQHPFNNHISPTTPHGTNSYFPSRTTSPTTSSNYIDYRKQQQQNDHHTLLSTSSNPLNDNNNNNNNSGIDINDWIDDELNHHLQQQHHHTSSPPTSQQPSTSSIQNNNNNNNNEATRMDFQAHLLVSYKGNMSMTILTELKMNYPSMEFMSLPIQLCVRSVEFEATAVVAYIQSMSRVCVSMLEAEDDEITTLREKDIIGLGSLLRHVQIESIVGDEQKHVLKNVGKIERFIVDQLRRMLDDELVFPSYQCVELS
ncbi:unnamed protein product [Cunninghamella blakesleeana]